MKRKLSHDCSDDQGLNNEIGPVKSNTFINEQLLFVLGEFPTCKTDIKSPIAIRRWIKSRGVLIELLASTGSIAKEIITLSDLSLSHLLSALIDEIITEHGNKIDSNNNINQLLTFVERVLVQKYNIIYTVQNHQLFETWISTASSDSPALETNSNINIGKDLTSSHPNPEPRDFYNRAAGGWVISLCFIISYDILYIRLGDLKSEKIKLESKKSNNDIHSTGWLPGNNLFVKAARDPIVLKSIQIMLFLQFIEIHRQDESIFIRKNSNTKIRRENSILKHMFGPNLQRVDSLVKSIHHEVLKQYEYKYEELFDDKMSIKKCGEDSVFSRLMAEVNGDPYANCMVDKYDDKKDISGIDKSITTREIDEEKDDQMHLTTIPISQNKNAISRHNENSSENEHKAIEDEIKCTPPNIMLSNSSIISSAKQLRSHLIEAADALEDRNDTVNLTETAVKISDLISSASIQDGTKGVLLVGFILSFGVENEKDWLEALFKFSSTDESEKPKIPLTDALVSDLCKTFINEESSHVRASAFMKCFIFPLLLNLTPGIRFASRALVSIVSSMVRERPTECIKSVLLPVLCGPGYFLGENFGQRRKLDLKPNIPTQAQCELVSRILKSVLVQKENISILISGITTNSNTKDMALDLTDATLPILTTCLKKKIILSDQVIIILVRNIVRLSNDTVTLKNMKYSTFFHTLVTKHGIQIKHLQLTPDLLDASSKIKTFMGKTITTALRRL